MSDNTNNENEQQNNQPVFDIIRIYSKDCSLETPNIPNIFAKPWKPSIKVDFDAKPKMIAEGNYEVDLRITVTCKLGEENEEQEVAFICEVHQAGMFLVNNVDQPTLDYLLGGVAPNILFPYAREHISSLVNRASFPALNLRPINFEGMYRARQAELAAQSAQQQAEPAKEEAPQA